MTQLLERWNGFLWGIPVLGLILGVGIYLTARLGVVQLRYLPAAMADFARRLGGGDSSFRALCTALAATVGTGNIAGVAGAIAIGGPGAVFWMWVSAVLGMGIKFAESTLAVRFREGDRGGPMYIIRRGLGKKWQFLGTVYSLFGIIAAFGVGNATQINAVVATVRLSGEALGFSSHPMLALAVGAIMAAVVVKLMRDGAGRIGQTAELLIPLVSGVYIVLCVLAVWKNRGMLPRVVVEILSGAFSPGAVTGGMVGSFLTTVRIGVSRGTFTNEAGMGTAAIAHAGAEVSHPAEQGLMGIMEVFLDTIVICTLTALVILTSGVSIPYGTSAGAELTAQALAWSFGPWVTGVLCGCLCLFALATILGWGFYAARCAEFLFGRLSWRAFAWCQGGFVMLGAVLETGIVWTLAELVNGLMAIPNLIMLVLLTPELKRLTDEWKLCYNRKHRI